MYLYLKLDLNVLYVPVCQSKTESENSTNTLILQSLTLAPASQATFLYFIHVNTVSTF